MADEPERKEGSMPDLPKQVEAGRYSNIAKISHTFDEFTLEFGIRIAPKVAGLHTKIISSPSHAKRLLIALKKNIDRYEAKFGPIQEQPPVQEPSSTPPEGERSDVR